MAGSWFPLNLFRASSEVAEMAEMVMNAQNLTGAADTALLPSAAPTISSTSDFGKSETQSGLLDREFEVKGAVVPRKIVLADRLGICLSGLCAIHCLLTPLLLLLVPSFHFFHAHGEHGIHEVFHSTLLIVLPLVALLAFVPGYLRHRNWRVFAWALAGFLLIGTAAISFHDQLLISTALMIPGSLLLIRAHYLNRNLCACCISGHSRTQSKINKTRFTSAAHFRRANFRPSKPVKGRLLSTPDKR